jgi:hypothetical protein
LRAIDRVQHTLHAARLRRCRAVLANLIVEHDEPDRVVLTRREIRERGGEELAVQELRHLAGREPHRGARIEQDHEPRIGLADIALDVGALGARVHVPIDEPRIVAFAVRLVLGELLAETEERRAVHSGQESRNHGARHEIEIRKRRKRLRTKEVLGRRSDPCRGHEPA